jgi:acyl-CoA reductase-like NAD-dependent aldehyde dehydrogenase
MEPIVSSTLPQDSTQLDTTQLDADLQLLHEKRLEWATLELPKKIKLLEELLERIGARAEAQATDAIKAKGIAPSSHQRGEEWLGGPMAQARVTRQLIEALKSLHERGHTGVTDKHATRRPNGQLAVKVFPNNLIDQLSFAGFTAEVWLQADASRDDWAQRTGSFYRDGGADEGALALVLGAGNVASIGLLDALHKLFVEGRVCFLKFNPVNDYLAPHYKYICAPLIERGYMRMCKGGAPEGIYLCQHELVEEIHITGSDKTHDAIIYGVGEEGARRKEADEPVCHKEISSELGNVSPVIITPGVWTDKELRFHAENVATQMTNNGGFNCNAARVIITHRGWPQREAFLQALREILAQVPQRPAYYPGAHERFERFINSEEGAERIDGATQADLPSGSAQPLPWGLITGVDPEGEHICFTQESFCGLAAETSLEAEDASAFLKAATEFANERLWGSLNACVIIDPKTAKQHSQALEQAIETLRYGSVCVNHWPALSYGMGVTAWGAYPGHTRQDIQRGVGFVHNTYLLEGVEKTVIRGPFTVSPKPLWFVTHRRSEVTAKALTKMEQKPSLLKFPKVLLGALRP